MQILCWLAVLRAKSANAACVAPSSRRPSAARRSRSHKRKHFRWSSAWPARCRRYARGVYTQGEQEELASFRSHQNYQQEDLYKGYVL